MRALVFAFALAAGAGFVALCKPAQAHDYRYCLYEDNSEAGDCYYDTYAQCEASASGRVGYCNINPRAAFAQMPRSDHFYQQRPVE
jgi:hypothetical protein